MATRIEKIYKTNSFVLLNDILNLIKEYAEKNPKMTKREAEFYKEIIKTINSFLNVNNISDAELRNAVEKGKRK